MIHSVRMVLTGALLAGCQAGCDSTNWDFAIDDPPLSPIAAGFQTGISIESRDAQELGSPQAAASLESLRQRNARFVQIVVPWYQDFYFSNEMYPSAAETPSMAALNSAILTAKEHGLRVFLSPRIEVPSAHRDLIHPGDIDAWFGNYRRFILQYAALAESRQVDMLSIGTGMPEMSEFAGHWKALIDSVHTRFRGNLIYSADYSEFQTVPFWQYLDYIGIEAFFPLTTINDPEDHLIRDAWAHWTRDIEQTVQQYRRPVIFTSLGYTSQNGTNRQPASESITSVLDLDEQALCFKVFFDTFFGRNWMSGVYIWGWTVSGNGGPADLSYTPRNKPAEEVIKVYFGLFNGLTN